MQDLSNNPTAELEIIREKNVLITKSMFVGSLRGIHNSCLPQNLTSSYINKANFFFFGSALKNKLSFLESNNYFFLTNLWGTGYYHWLVEIVPKFFMFEEEIKKGTMLFPDTIPNFTREFLEVFNFKNYKLYHGNCFVRKLNVITNTNSGHHNTAQIKLLKTELLQRVGDDSREKFEKIYVSRRNAAKRKVLNEDEVEEKLKQAGFVCLELDNMSFVEQVNLFRRCKCFVSIHGAALTNCIFMPEGSRIFELLPEIPPKSELSGCFYRLSRVLNLKHEFVPCKREFEDREFCFDTENIYVDANELIRKINGGNQ